MKQSILSFYICRAILTDCSYLVFSVFYWKSVDSEGFLKFSIFMILQQDSICKI